MTGHLHDAIRSTVLVIALLKTESCNRAKMNKLQGDTWQARDVDLVLAMLQGLCEKGDTGIWRHD